MPSPASDPQYRAPIIRMQVRTTIDPPAEGDIDDRTVTVRCSTEMVGRDDIVLVTRGIELDNYRNNPIWLWQHNPDWPVARAVNIDFEGTDLVQRVRFPPAGVSQRADEVLGLIRACIVNAASTGFDPKETEPLDPANRKAGIRITRSELQEMSFVSIPAVPDALVMERALSEARRLMTERPQLSRALTTRDLYDVGSLAYVLNELGWITDCAAWEADMEQDGSNVPAMLGNALKVLGECLVAMTAEEVAELVAAGPAPMVEEAVTPEENAIVEQSATPALARFRIGMHRAKALRVAGKAPSATITRHDPLAKHKRMAQMFKSELRA